MFQFILREASLLFAFIVLGALLLLCVWVSQNVQTTVLREFKNAQISVVLKEGAAPQFQKLIESDSNVIRYETFDAKHNKERLQTLYPELRNIITPLEEEYFPGSAIVSVNDAPSFLKKLQGSPELFETQILHEPPTQLRQFLSALTFVFSALWLLTLALVLYFNLERLTHREEARWSLMKMLGAKQSKLFLPLWYGQAIRITIASLSAIGLAVLVSHHVRGYFIWNWVNLPAAAWTSFFLVSIGMTSLISFGLFRARYKHIAIG